MAYSLSQQGLKYLLPFVGFSQPVTEYPDSLDEVVDDDLIEMNVNLRRVVGMSERANSGRPR